MFFTEIKSQNRTRPSTSTSLAGNSISTGFTHPRNKIHEIKKQFRSINQEYRQSLQNVKTLQRSIQKMNAEVQFKRVEFIKKYEQKKLKLESDKLLSQKKNSDDHRKSLKITNVKQQKLCQELQSSITALDYRKEQNEQRRRNRLQKERLRALLADQQEADENEARRRYEQTRRYQQNLRNKKQAIRDLTRFQAKKGYRRKIEQESTLIAHYDNLYAEIDREGSYLGLHEEEFADCVDNPLFMTCKESVQINNYL